MQVFIDIGIGLGVGAIISIVLIIIKVKKIIKAHGIETIIGRWLMGRHHAGHLHTTATFWRDSDGKRKGDHPSRALKRYHRAGWKNVLRNIGYFLGTCIVICGVIYARTITIICILLLILGLIGYKCFKLIKTIRKAHYNKVRITPLARALATVPGVHEIDMENDIQLAKNYEGIKKGLLGKIYFPDSFRAEEGETTIVSNIVNRRLPQNVELNYYPPLNKERQHFTLVACPELPTWIPFSDCLTDIARNKPGEYIIGYDRDGKPLRLSHRKDRPMKAFTMDSGTGKSTTLRSIIAQLKMGNPKSRHIIWDVKQISLECFRGVPGVTIYSDPSEMGDMWKGWELLFKEMKDRYAIIKKDPTRRGTFDPIFGFLEEGNTFADMITDYWKEELRLTLDRDHPHKKINRPPIWGYISKILWQGREVDIFLDCVFQNFLDAYFGGKGLRNSFQSFGLAGYSTQQWNNVIGTRPMPVPQEGQGRIIIVEGRSQTWVQSMYAEEEYYTKMALEACKLEIPSYEKEGA